MAIQFYNKIHLRPSKVNDFFSAIESGNIEKFEEYVAADRFILHNTNCFTQTPLIVATQFGRTDIVKRLLELKDCPNVLDNQMLSPLQYAIMYDRFEIFKMLHEAGALLMSDGDWIHGQTLLMTAAAYAREKFLLYLLERKVNLERRCGKHHRTALVYAVMIPHNPCVRLLIDAGANVNVSHRYTPVLATALEHGCYEHAKSLVDAGADVEADYVSGGSLLIHATEKGDIKMMAFLLNVGALVENSNGLDDSPLMRAVRRGQHDAAIFLISRGANLNRRNAASHTPLMYAAIRGDNKMVSILLASGARTDLTNRAGITARDAAVRGNHQHTVDVFDNTPMYETLQEIRIRSREIQKICDAL